MRGKAILILMVFWGFSFTVKSYAFKEATHTTINEHVAQNPVGGFDLNTYLIHSLGITGGTDSYLKAIDAEQNERTAQIFWWLGYGGEREDRPGEILDYITQQPTRSFNHFHNPIKSSWSEAGLNDYILVPIVSPVPPFLIVGYTKKWYTGQSSILWAQNSQQSVGGQWSWSNARKYFYDALTLKGKDQRDRNSADTFRAVGQLMHLVHDSSVPEHIRNDIHVLPSFGDNYPAYEMQIEELRTTDSTFWRSLVSNPISFDKSILGILSSNASAQIPISRIIDTDLYTGNNPAVTATLQSFSQKIGLSEYTNANFVSKDSMFESESPHGFSYPRVEDLSWWIDRNKWYLAKVGSGDAIRHFLRTSWLYWYRWKLFPQYNKYLPIGQDKECFKDYAQRLIPRAVGYSAGLLDYFFRGDIKLNFQGGTSSGYVIANNTQEDMSGMFEIYYDNLQEERVRLWSGNPRINASQKSAVINLPIVSNAKEPGKYILVFRGKMGNEEDAVAGYVTGRSIDITPPEQQVYAMVDASTGLGFDSIRVKLRNRSTSEAMQNGTLKAIVRYKHNTLGNALYTASDPVTVQSLDSAQATEYSFTFPNPIPIHATDVYLYVSFTGTIGTEANAVAAGEKDISEPTPVDLFNNMDRICINSQWYTAGSPAAISMVDANNNGIANEWDVYSHDVRDIYIRFSSDDAPLYASPTEYNYYFANIPAGAHQRVLYILADYKFSYGIYNKWLPATASGDRWTHVDESFPLAGNAVKEQTEITSDPAICGSRSSCPKVHTSTYYTYRGTDMWAGAGLIYINAPYPKTAVCP